MGWLERIELSIPVPQTGVLPLNYSHRLGFNSSPYMNYLKPVLYIIYSKNGESARQKIL
jgi:hypothetical protein